MPIPEKILDLIDNDNYEVEIGKYVSDGFALVQKHLVLFLVFGVVVVITQLVGQIPIIGLVIAVSVGPAISAGGYIASDIAYRGERELEFGDFFKGFEHIAQLTVLTIVLILIICAIFVPLGILGFLSMDLTSSNPSPMAIFFVALLFLVPFIYLFTCYAFAVPFLIFEKLSFWDALESSRKLISKKWGSYFLLFLVIGLIYISGLLLIGIGIIFTIPASIAISYMAFKDITGYGQEIEEDDDILQHLIEE